MAEAICSRSLRATTCRRPSAAECGEPSFPSLERTERRRLLPQSCWLISLDRYPRLTARFTQPRPIASRLAAGFKFCRQIVEADPEVDAASGGLITVVPSTKTLVCKSNGSFYARYRPRLAQNMARTLRSGSMTSLRRPGIQSFYEVMNTSQRRPQRTARYCYIDTVARSRTPAIQASG